jgi:uncharacterized protein YbbK (DUF523 family)/uncharacterized protein YbgA (DUF1722 family)
VCPEVGIGMGVPRPPIRLVGPVRAPRARGRDDATLDVTAELAAYGRRQAGRLDDISGYLFKSRSPSCGLTDVPVFTGARSRPGRGIYAAAILARHPWLPAEDEQGIADAARRDHFFERVFAYRRWQALEAPLAAFHAAHECVLLAHRPRAAKALEKIAAGGKRAVREYLAGFMTALVHPATAAGHERVLRHLAARLRGKIDREAWRRLRAHIAAFRAGRIPRARVLALLRRHFRRHPDPHVLAQVYLFPDPVERRLRGL